MPLEMVAGLNQKKLRELRTRYDSAGAAAAPQWVVLLTSWLDRQGTRCDCSLSMRADDRHHKVFSSRGAHSEIQFASNEVWIESEDVANPLAVVVHFRTSRPTLCLTAESVTDARDWRRGFAAQPGESRLPPIRGTSQPAPRPRADADGPLSKRRKCVES
jgi:hypothetical protein